MSFPPFSIQVPATTANVGPGFDSVGIALNLWMTVTISPNDEWSVRYEGDGHRELVTDEENLIVQTILHIAQHYEETLPPAHLQVQSEIPLGKGFGSSASAIAAGIVIAEHLLGRQFSAEEKVRIGTHLEGHADNVSAALLGGAVINHHDGENVHFIHVEEVVASFIVFVPPTALKTTEARDLLPEKLLYSQAVKGSTASAVLAAALIKNDWKMVGTMMEKDQFHEQYRKTLFPHFDAIRQACRQLGANGMTISGAGPSLIASVAEEDVENLLKELQDQFPYYHLIAVQSVNQGAGIKL